MIKNKIVYTATHQRSSRIIVTVLMAAFAVGMPAGQPRYLVGSHQVAPFFNAA